MTILERLEFVSYDGKYPNLCSGTLILKKGDKKYSIEYALVSGGECYFTNNYENEVVTSGDWIIEESSLPEELVPFIDKITELVNENIPKGCCGGCL